ncbi:cytochrome c biogenesis protein CcdA [Pseudoduganella flava]|uniref:Cytochrome c biogenesis protein CcdA n=1 Tax=Pseudoduganella flava TaxID=871742 RepID=A0A562PUJ3_9BURK|nr:cytochrome c biogenesis CcdA family protein [Pseudoduganella flava]QGZ38969.1 cytochrome c biogenesis protein CcdA [Pseudoduganella flava]TWI47766.1 cytochrome c biogenesis protein CcdA [Pseudoduganella flava]
MNHLLESPLAFGAGLFTVASPCILPVLPILLGAGSASREDVRPLRTIAGFVITFTFVGMLLGAASSAVHVAQETLRNASLLLLGVFGLLRIWSRPYDWLVAKLPSVPVPAQGGFLLGASLGAVWTPCAGPVLASILVLVAGAQDVARSAWLLFLYALGAALPMLAILAGGQAVTGRVRLLARHSQRLQQVFGVLIVATAIAMYLQYDVLVYAKAASLFPNLPQLKGL